MNSTNDDLEQHLCALACQTPWFAEALAAVHALRLDAWCIGAGAVRNLVWDHLHGLASPSALSDIDVAHFDATDLGSERDAYLQRELAARHPHVPWEVTNQAGVHLWFQDHFGHAVAPLASLEDAVASWPEFATAVGISLLPDGTPQVIAPHGLDDLFGMVVNRPGIRGGCLV